jgi:acetylornithine aminotransferase
MGNGFPIGGILIAPHFKASYGLLGTTLWKSFGLRSKYRCFRYYRSQNLMENAKMSKHISWKP